MKKSILSLVLVLCLLLTPTVCFASYTNAPSETKTAMGDCDKNGKITPTDARIALRVVSKLDKRKLSLLTADTNADGKINITDARRILRVSANLDTFDNGFDFNSNPYQAKILEKRKFKVSVVQEVDDTKIPLTFSTIGKNYDIEVSLEKAFGDEPEMKDIAEMFDEMGVKMDGIRIANGKMYVLFVNIAKEKIAWSFVSDAFKDMNDIVDDFEFVKDLIPQIKVSDFKEVATVKKGKTSYIRYTQNSSKSDSLIYVYCDTFGRIKLIEQAKKSSPEKVTDYINITSINSFNNDSIFKLTTKTVDDFGATEKYIGEYCIQEW